MPWKPGYKSPSVVRANKSLATVPLRVLRKNLLVELAQLKACRGQTFRLGIDIAGNSPDLFSYVIKTAIYIVKIDETPNERQYREESGQRLITMGTTVHHIHAKEILLNGSECARRIKILILSNFRDISARV